VAPVIEVHDLHKRYRARDPWAVQGVSFAMEPGRAFGLLGPNGAGKSTVVKIVVDRSRIEVVVDDCHAHRKREQGHGIRLNQISMVRGLPDLRPVVVR
jgi:ABC-type multidrug transport system ATPase subunit